MRLTINGQEIESVIRAELSRPENDFYPSPMEYGGFPGPGSLCFTVITERNPYRPIQAGVCDFAMDIGNGTEARFQGFFTSAEYKPLQSPFFESEFFIKISGPVSISEYEMPAETFTELTKTGKFNWVAFLMWVAMLPVMIVNRYRGVFPSGEYKRLSDCLEESFEMGEEQRKYLESKES